MVNHLKRGKALRERLPLTYLVYEVSQLSLKAYTSGASKDQDHQRGSHGHGHRGQPVLPSVQRLGSRRERKGQGDEHATCIVPFESSMLNTGTLPRNAKASGQ